MEKFEQFYVKKNVKQWMELELKMIDPPLYLYI
jgi:hypothetical protein